MRLPFGEAPQLHKHGCLLSVHVGDPHSRELPFGNGKGLGGPCKGFIIICEFTKIRVTFLMAPVVWILVFCGPYWGPPI